MRILVAEDDALTAMVLQLALQAGGHVVIGPVADMEEGLGVAAADPPDLALLDVTLSGADDGLELARYLRLRHGTVCLLVSALPGAAERGAAVAVGIIHKPYEPSTALRSVEVVRRLLAGEASPMLPHGLELFTPPGMRAPVRH